MADYGHELRFGVFISPAAGQSDRVLELATLADVAGLDLVSFQDHPYQPQFLDAWTLLSVVAAQTTNVRVALNVANLPLRPPFVLARSVASLDLLSGGRVELGLGAGAFWDAIAAVGGPRLTPGQGVDALAEAIELIRAVWSADGAPIHHRGVHYDVDGAQPGPPPAHDVEIWLGAYKPRMLALTGARADGWLPSMGYASLEELPGMNAAIDAAAVEAGRRPDAIRRLFNVNGGFGDGDGFLEGPPHDWAEQLTELTLLTGMSTYVLSVSSEAELRTFAEEVAPAVRELVEEERARGGRERDAAAAVGGGTGGADAGVVAGAGASAAAGTDGTPFATVPTPDDGRRLSDERPWDESTRPSGPARDPSRRFSADQQAAGRHLIDVHDGLRGELERLRDLIAQVAQGTTDPAAVRSHINRMTIRQNNWTLGTFCETYCRVVTGHHTLEDDSVFPHLERRDPALQPVIDRLGEEHETISELLERVDRTLVALVAAEPDGMERVQASVDLLTDALLSHFSYEERELIEPLARLGFY
ncbi:LLM class flavin-dependent oxidoreductase [Conexibacter woesei]|uniref:Putative F420-dependent oxidoreductase n=1 Tax=Conexibacter woesei (strain DSM 14684 / CCUG 47730 / CIP 108061 / JCM 11494 / NBRC 100937 / ID131577) TaxID=469383 RepID=D3F7M1_CONWI|nr:LLM class flavin-dependent oxidoreductase [Conexibacter woesei]ADB50883.1 putative F420-dependent oxidoreductase [Conexibacter woesei DSM 14684]